MADYSNLSESALISLFQTGDTAALSILYTRHHQKLLYFLQKGAKSSTLAEDLLHDTFIKVWENREKLDPEQPFKPYLYTIAQHQLFNLLKRARHEQTILAQMQQGALTEVNATELQLDFKESSLLLEEAIRQLPPRCREVFQKCYIEELSYKETATELRISESTVHNQMVKALRIVREYITLRNGLALLMASVLTASLLAG